MDDFRSRSKSLTTSLLAKASSKAARTLSFDANSQPLKEKIGELANSFNSILSETKSYVSSFLDEGQYFFKDNSLSGIRNVSSDRDDGRSGHSPMRPRCSSLGTRRYVNEIDFGKKVGRNSFSADDSACFERKNVSLNTLSSISEHECLSTRARDDGIQSRYQISRATGANNNNKCIEWMSKLPEEVTPKTMRKSMSEFGMWSQSRRRNGDTFQDKVICQKRTDKKFVKANSESGQYYINCLNGVELYNFKPVSCSITPEEPMEPFHDNIRQAIVKVLGEIDEKKLVFVMHQLDVPEGESEPNLWEDTVKGAVNIIPECEQCFKWSPHVKRKFAVYPDVTPQLEKEYINSKTDMFTKSTKVQDVHVGEIGISIQYLIVTERLKVTVNNVCSLQQPSRKNDKFSIFVNVSLVSNRKRNKDTQTKTHRRSGTTNFNYDMYFKNIKFENVHLLCLRFGVYEKSTLFSRKHHKCIGESFVYLDGYDVVGKVHLTEKIIACD